MFSLSILFSLTLSLLNISIYSDLSWIRRSFSAGSDSLWVIGGG